MMAPENATLSGMCELTASARVGSARLTRVVVLLAPLVDRGKGLGGDRVTEMLERGFLGEGSFRTKKGDGQRGFECKTGGHDFAEQARSTQACRPIR